MSIAKYDDEEFNEFRFRNASLVSIDRVGDNQLLVSITKGSETTHINIDSLDEITVEVEK